MQTLHLKKHKTRFIDIYSKDDCRVPKELFGSDLSEIGNLKLGEPLPFKKSEAKFYAVTGKIIWVASSRFVCRIDKTAESDYDRVWVFSAKRDMPTGEILHILPTEDDVWVETENGVSHISLKEVSVEEKADALRDQSVEIVDRMGMISARGLENPYDLSTRVKFHDCDNDGGFTANWAIGEMCHYAVLKKELGKDDPKTQKAFKCAVRATESCLLLMMIAGRDDGFPARTFITSDAPCPDDGLFLRKTGGKATVIESTFTNKKGITGKTYDASAKIPDRLTKLYRDEGYTDDDIIFKGDTSSDEVTLHFLNLYYANKILAPEDEELGEIIQHCTRKLIDHIIEHGFELYDCYGKATSWAKWSKSYFTGGIGWADAPENACEMLAYLLLSREITGDEKYKKVYDELVADGYADLTVYHYDRAFATGITIRRDVIEDLMYGDHMLANISFFTCLKFEKDEKLREIYKKSWMIWRNSSIAREHTPIYDMMFMSVCPETPVDTDELAKWFYRYNMSNLQMQPSTEMRRDIPRKEFRADKIEMGYKVPQDEGKVSNYDTDPFSFPPFDNRWETEVQSSASFTTPYWFGRYEGIIIDEGAEK